MSISISHDRMVDLLVKPGQQIIDELTPHKAHLLHMAIGISGEAGELLDAIKKHCIYNLPLDIVNVKEECGDLEFYQEGLRQCLGLLRKEILDGNIEKLSKRYESLKYSNRSAQERKDKQ